VRAMRGNAIALIKTSFTFTKHLIINTEKPWKDS
jgi:hypothetical protein